MRFASLGSGSEGNALVVEAGSTRVLLDCGFGLRETERRLGRLGLTGSDLQALVITHEHGDHAGGIVRLARKYGLPIWTTHGTWAALELSGRDMAPANPALQFVDLHATFVIGDLELFPFPVPHDAREPAQYAFSDGARRIGVLTDAGSVTSHMVAMLSGCDALVLECNHDAEMLASGPYPPRLKARVGGRFGHLENGQAADLLNQVRHDRLQHVIAAHLSRQNNSPERARAALAGALACAPSWIGVADQVAGFGWRSV